MTIWQAILLGIIQGATEFLPVSSSGHLVLLPWLFGWHEIGESNLAFDALVHWGTLAAVVTFFWRDIVRVVAAVWDGLRRRQPLGTPEARLGWFIAAGSIPAALAGFLLEDWFAARFGDPRSVAVLLFGTAGLLFVAERAGRGMRTVEQMGWLDALVIGLAQALAILPGISRSGATIAAGLKRGLERAEAARFSFLLGIPAILGAGAWQMVQLLQTGSFSEQAGVLAAGFVAAAVVGYLAIYSFLAYLRSRTLDLFAAYCALLGAISLVVYVARG